MTGTSAPAAVFVYGTLLPGHVRWHLVEPFVAAARPGRVPGRLFDTGHRYPAALFSTGPSSTGPSSAGPSSTGPSSADPSSDGPGPPAGDVHGAVLLLRPERAAAALEVLDLVEGGEYDRIEVAAIDDASGEITRCWTYEWTAPLERLVHLPSGRWTGV